MTEKKWTIELEEFIESIFHEMEDIQDGNESNIATFNGENKTEVATEISKRLIPFLKTQLKYR